MKTVLLIDDDQPSRLILSQHLSKAGWTVIEAEDGEIGLGLVREKRPHAVVCDLLMPKSNGFQVCRSVREWGAEIPQPKIVVTTASGYATDRLNAYEAGADGVMIKPVKPSELVELLDTLISGAGVTEFIKRGSGKAGDTSTSLGTVPRRRTLSADEKQTLVRFWGVRGSIPTPGAGTAYYGGNTSCVELRAEGEIIILDAGTGIRGLGLKLASEFKDKPLHASILMTHTHWDHIQGFPFFIPAYNPKNQFQILGYEGARRGLETTLSSQMESPYFPISMQQMPGNIVIREQKELHFQVGPVKVQAQFMNHPGVCVGYRLTTSAGSIAYLPDNEPFFRLKSQPQPGLVSDKDHAAALDYARQQDQKLIDFLRDVDVLIIDSQYDATEYPRHVGWGHTCVDDSVGIALEAGAKQLFLFHHDPGHDDQHVARMEAHARDIVQKHGGTLKVQAAREGLECVLKVPQAVSPVSV